MVWQESTKRISFVAPRLAASVLVSGAPTGPGDPATAVAERSSMPGSCAASPGPRRACTRVSNQPLYSAVNTRHFFCCSVHVRSFDRFVCMSNEIKKQIYYMGMFCAFWGTSERIGSSREWNVAGVVPRKAR